MSVVPIVEDVGKGNGGAAKSKEAERSSGEKGNSKRKRVDDPIQSGDEPEPNTPKPLKKKKAAATKTKKGGTSDTPTQAEQAKGDYVEAAEAVAETSEVDKNANGRKRAQSTEDTTQAPSKKKKKPGEEDRIAIEAARREIEKKAKEKKSENEHIEQSVSGANVKVTRCVQIND